MEREAKSFGAHVYVKQTPFTDLDNMTTFVDELVGAVAPRVNITEVSGNDPGSIEIVWNPERVSAADYAALVEALVYFPVPKSARK